MNVEDMGGVGYSDYQVAQVLCTARVVVRFENIETTSSFPRLGAYFSILLIKETSVASSSLLLSTMEGFDSLTCIL